MHKIAEIVSISTERVVNILHTHLYIRKLGAKHIGVATLEHNIDYFNRNPKEFCVDL